MMNNNNVYAQGFVDRLSTVPKLAKLTKLAQTLENVKTLDNLTARELTRAIRDALMGEQEAIKQYETVVDSTTNTDAKKVLTSIVNEERAHTGELQALLNKLAPDEQKLQDKGEQETKE